MTDGTRANRAGSRLERFVADTLDERGYGRVSPSRRFIPARELAQPIWAAQFAVGQNIYGNVRRVDAILYHPELWPECLVIQCKWQSSSGSVDEKYPFEVLNIEQGEYRTIIVLDGGGYSPGAEAWLKAQAGLGGNLLHVFDQGGFQRWVSRGRI